MHGDTLLWAGVNAGTADLSRRSMVRHRLFVAPPSVAPLELEHAQAADMSALAARLAELPLRNNCVDAMVLHHTLELSRDPRASLREAARVLQPGGQMVICAFNLLGIFSLCRTFAPVPGSYLNPFRLKDWLEILGFESVVATEHALYRPPWGIDWFDAPRLQRPRALIHRSGVPTGNVFLVHARKKALSIRPDWQLAPRRRVALAGAAYPKLVDTHRKVP